MKQSKRMNRRQRRDYSRLKQLIYNRKVAIELSLDGQAGPILEPDWYSQTMKDGTTLVSTYTRSRSHRF